MKKLLLILFILALTVFGLVANNRLPAPQRAGRKRKPTPPRSLSGRRLPPRGRSRPSSLFRQIPSSNMPIACRSRS